MSLSSSPKILSFLSILFTFSISSHSVTFIITNNCTYTVWPGTLSGGGSLELSPTGFRLDPGRSMKLTSDPKWSGRIWGRTGCRFDADGNGKCETADCGGKLECKGSGAEPPASLFEITLAGADGKDFYDVSMVDGYNLPMLAVPRKVYGGPACNSTGCLSNLNQACPKELQVVSNGTQGGGVVACKSACEAFGSDEYCCSGQFANPTTCRPSKYSSIFKKACPRAYSYAFDDKTSTFTCKAYEYQITFCPRGSRTKKPSRKAQAGSSSNLLPPLPLPIFLFIITLTFSTFGATWPLL